MSDEQKAPTGALDNADAVASQENNSTEAVSDASDSVKYETYARKKSLADNLAKAKRELEDKVAKLEQEKFEAEGNKDKVIETLKSQVEKLSAEKQEIFGNVTYSSIQSQIEAEASKLGCIDTEALVQLMDMNGFANSVDPQTFKANTDEVRAAIEEQKRNRAYLFSKAGPKINSSSPNAELTQSSPKKSIDEMTHEEQIALAKEIDKMEGKTLGWT
jgi:hypothetical protein